MWNPFTRRNLFSAKRHNKVANLVHSLCNLQVVRGSKDKITVTESNAILELKRSEQTAQATVRVKLCDPYTGEVKTYDLYGVEVVT